MLLRPTRVHEKFGGFHIPAHGYAKNAPGFRLKPSAGDISGRMQYAPTRVRAKFGGFHIPAHEYTKNAPDFTLPNKDTPKTHPILDPNLWRGTFWGVYNTPLHGYMQNLASFRPKPSARIVSGRMLLRPTRVHPKNCPVSYFPTRMRPKPAQFSPSQ